VAVKRAKEKRWTIKHGRFDEKVHACAFPSGLTAFFIPKPGFVKSFALLGAKYGSNDIEFFDPAAGKKRATPPGVAHFLEHQLFETEQGNATAFFAKLGASVNAYTSYNTTAYYFTTTRNFAQSLDVLLGFVMVPYFALENVERERGIIESEIRGYVDSPGWRAFYHLNRALFVKHPIRIDTAGTVSSIRKITAPLLTRCHKLFYHPGNLVLVAAGDLDPGKFFKQVGRFLNQLSPPPWRKVKRLFPAEPKRVFRKTITERLEVSQPRLLVGYKDTSPDGGAKKLLSKTVELRIALDLLFSRSAPAFTEFYETGICEDAFACGYDIEPGYGYIYIGGPTPKPNILRRRIEEVISKAKRTGFASDDFDRVKSKLLGQSIRYFNSVEALANWQYANALAGLSLFDYLDVLESVRRSHVERRLRDFFKPSASAASIILPKKK
jgi:predicted Zn-dependent peptidase